MFVGSLGLDIALSEFIKGSRGFVPLTLIRLYRFHPLRVKISINATANLATTGVVVILVYVISNES